MMAYGSGFASIIGKRDRLIEGDARFVFAIELQEKRTLGAEEMKVAGKARRQRFDHCQGRGRPMNFARRNGAIERDDRGGLQALQRSVKRVDFAPVGVFVASRT